MAGNDPMPMRSVNFWGHIRNWYEVHSLQDNTRLLEDIASMGFSDFCTTFERELFRNYLDDQASDDNARTYWHMLKGLGSRAHELGLTVTVVDEVNTVFTDQWGDPNLHGLLAQAGSRWPASWGKKNYLFCPSQPEGREIILRNHELAYKGYPVIDAAVLWGYDPSGCGCEACSPWPKTVFELGHELAARLHRYHPGAAVYLSAWDMSQAEVDLLTDLLNRDDSGTFQGIWDKDWLLVDMESGQPQERWAKLDARYLRIPYIDICQIGLYGWRCFTANPYPTRFEALFAAMRQAGIDHYSAYSEDIHDDINKYLIAGLGKDRTKKARELIREYAVRYFQAAVGDDLYDLCCMMEDERTNKLRSPWVQEAVMDLERAHKQYDLLKRIEARLPAYVVRGWRWQVLATRAELSLLLNELGDLSQTKAEIEGVLRGALSVKTSEEAHDNLQQADNLVQSKFHLLAKLKDTVDHFRVEVLQEPGYRTIRVHSALREYYDWHKMLIEQEETIGLATRIFVNGIQDVIRERLGAE
jgi:hypothetical protein